MNKRNISLFFIFITSLLFSVGAFILLYMYGKEPLFVRIYFIVAVVYMFFWALFLPILTKKSDEDIIKKYKEENGNNRD